jgi:hypothetical protein
MNNPVTDEHQKYIFLAGSKSVFPMVLTDSKARPVAEAKPHGIIAKALSKTGWDPTSNYEKSVE